MFDSEKIKIIKAPFVCTVPSTGLRAIQCFSDAITFFAKGEQYGYSDRAKTLIAPIEVTLKEAKEAQKTFLKYRHDRS